VGEGRRLYRFRQKGINAQDCRALGVYKRTIARAQDDRNVRTNTPQFPYQSLACHGGHGLIRDDEIKALRSRTKGCQRVETAGRDRDVISQADQRFPGEGAQGLFVIHKQQTLRPRREWLGKAVPDRRRLCDPR
jgi:hypothetical protein